MEPARDAPEAEADPAEAESKKVKRRDDTLFEELESSLELLVLEDSEKSYEVRRSRGLLGTGLVYHEAMDSHRCLWDPEYPECPQRFTTTLSRFKELGLHDRCQLITPRKAEEEEILCVHSKEYFDKIKATEGITDVVKLEELSSQFDAVYFHPQTFELALFAAGSCIDLVTDIVTDKIKNGFALVRPPGHHAMKDEACGYCFFNNVAIAASHAIAKHGLQRILIVDWDVHHGQATQYTFNDDPRVIYFSIHRYQKGAFWPELIESNYNWVGVAEGLGFNVNVPLNETGLNNRDILAIWHNVLLPIAYEFSPQLVLISAGYDAAIGCPEGEMLVSPTCYAHLCHSLMSLANGKVGVLFEGGYCIPSLAEGAAMTLKALLSDSCPQLNPGVDEPIYLHKSNVESILDVIWALKPYWKCFAIQGEFDRHADDKEVNELEEPKGKHYPVVEYMGTLGLKEEKPTKYETRGRYPIQSPQVKEIYKREIQRQIEAADLSIPEKRTCIVYNKDMGKHRHPGGSHPERPSRIKSIVKRLVGDGLLQRCHLIEEPRFATQEELGLVHTKEHIERIHGLATMDYKDVEELAASYNSIYLTSLTYENATLAAGSLLQVVDSVMTRETANGFAVIRPPGHHADTGKASGFCIFNNVAVAAKYAINKYGVNRVLIVDWDVHHGDGTQSIFINDEKVLYISLHRYDYSNFFPSTIESSYKVAKNVVNIPWNSGPMSDWEYMAAFFNIVLPVAYDFDPQLVLVSSGFDAALHDPLGEYHVSPQAYGHFTHHLLSLANGKVILALEGGYNLNSISSAASNCVSALLGDPLEPLELSASNPIAVQTLRDVMHYHTGNWPSLQFNVDLPANLTAN